MTTGRIQNRHFAFIELERVGGIMVYDISNPFAPVFVDYANSRNRIIFAGDNGPEGIIYIPRTHTANGKSYVIATNEVSGTLSTFELQSNIPNTSIPSSYIANDLIVFPNPVNGSEVFFSEAISLELLDMQGKLIMKADNAEKINVAGLAKGIYFIRTDAGITKKLVVE